MPSNFDEPWRWQESDLEQLISDQVQESLTLDYKDSRALADRSDVQKNDLSKDVSAFANSAGGTLVYGIREKGHLAEKIDDGLDPSRVTREWLETVINTRVQPRIDGLRVSQVPLPTSSPGRVAYVVHVPQSLRAPHMANDHRYYKRYNFSSVPMEDYEVKDVLNRQGSPCLTCGLSVLDVVIQPENGEKSTARVRLAMTVRNESSAVAEYWNGVFLMDGTLAWGALQADFSDEGSEFFLLEGQPKHMSRMSKNFGIPGSLPIWRDMSFRVGEFSIAIPETHTQYYLGWETNAPHATRRRGFYSISWDGHQVRLAPLDAPRELHQQDAS